MTPTPIDMEMHKTPEGKSFLVKRCGKCQVWKRVFPLGPDGCKVRKSNGAPKMAFTKNSKSSTGLHSWCTDCVVDLQKERVETKEGKAKQMYQSAKSNKSERMLLTQEEWVALFMQLWDEQDGRCSKTGWAFTLTQGAEKRNRTPSPRPSTASTATASTSRATFSSCAALTTSPRVTAATNSCSRCALRWWRRRATKSGIAAGYLRPADPRCGGSPSRFHDLAVDWAPRAALRRRWRRFERCRFESRN